MKETPCSYYMAEREDVGWSGGLPGIDEISADLCIHPCGNASACCGSTLKALGVSLTHRQGEESTKAVSDG